MPRDLIQRLAAASSEEEKYWLLTEALLQQQPAVLADLALAGLGGLRSIGMGACEIDAAGALSLPDANGGPWVTLSRPILWILHAAYAWIALGFGLLAMAQMGWVGVSAGVHALAIGATGGLIIGMVTRTARGHTGRPLQASRAEVLAYGLVMAAAVLRVLLPIVAPQWLVMSLLAAALAWSAAFAIYLVIYTPWLLSTRLDGKDG